MRVVRRGSVKVTYFDKEAAWKATEEFATELAGRPEVLRVVVFGSLVEGIPVPGSDVDIVVIVKDTEVPFLDRPAAYRPSRFPVGLDLFVYTQAESEQMLAENNFFLKRALGGKTLFERTAG